MIPLKPVSALVFACCCAFVPAIAAEPGDSGQSLQKLLKGSYFVPEIRMEAWARVREMDAAAVESAMEDLKKSGSEAADSQMLFFRLAQLDPNRALGHIDVEGLGKGGWEMMYELAVLAAWMERDPEAAYHHEWKGRMAPANAQSIMARALANQGLKPALEKSKAIGGEVRRQTLEDLAMKIRMGSLGSQAFLAALDLQDDEGSGRERQTCEALLLQHSAQRDPAALLESVRGDREKMAAALSEWQKNDPGGALTWVADHPDDWGLDFLISSYLSWLLEARDIAPRILPALEKRPGFLEGMVKVYLPIYVQAVQSASIQSQDVFCPFMRTLFRRWSAQDPAAASAWREGQPAYLRTDPTFTLSTDYIVPEPPPAPPVKPVAPADPDLLGSLQKLWWESPDPSEDFEWQWQTAQFLDKCSADQLAALFYGTGQLVGGGPDLHSQIAAAWARKDPSAAIEASLSRREALSAPGLFGSWLRRDPAAALGWEGSGKAGAERSKLVAELRISALGSLFRLDPQLAFSNLAYLDHQGAVAFFNRNIESQPYDATRNAAAQQSLLQAAGNCLTPAEMAELKASLAKQMARRDPAAARKLASSLVLPPGRAIELDAEITFDSYDPTGATLRDWVARNAGVVPLPKPVENQLDYETGRVPPDSNEWLLSLPAGLQRDAIYSHILNRSSSNAMKLLDKIDSPLFRAITLRNLDRIELRSQPDIEKWRQSLSESDRAFLDR